MVDPLRGELHAYCYRLLGSVHDADDAVQETMVRAWRAFQDFDGRAPRAWLYKIATNRCLTAIAGRGRRALPIDLQGDLVAAVEAGWVEPYPGARFSWADQLPPEERAVQRESVELAFVAALQHLDGRQRAILLLREVLGFTAAETADALGTSVAAVNSGLQRARRAVEERVPKRTQQQTLASLPVGVERDLAQRYADAWQNGDVDALVRMFAEDVTYSMPPLAELHAGRAAVRALLDDLAVPDRWRFVPTSANGQLAFGTYQWDESRQAHVATAVDVLTLRGEEVAAVVSFLGEGAFAGFGLPYQLR
jgi:RNA polymerase sigma-70 factor (TIGR02960 family)